MGSVSLRRTFAWACLSTSSGQPVASGLHLAFVEYKIEYHKITAAICPSKHLLTRVPAATIESESSHWSGISSSGAYGTHIISNLAALCLQSVSNNVATGMACMMRPAQGLSLRFPPPIHHLSLKVNLRVSKQGVQCAVSFHPMGECRP